MKIMLSYKSRIVCVWALLPAAFVLRAAPAGAQAIAGNQPAAQVYSVVNLAPGSGPAWLNEAGQAAFATYSSGDIVNGFFDGKRVHAIGLAGGRYVLVGGLGNFGTVVGQFDDAASTAPFNIRAFTWTMAGGLRALPGKGDAMAHAINEGNQVAGTIKGAAFYGRAYRWNPDGTATALGPLPASLSEALAINDTGLAVGYADVALHDSHAVVWDRNGAATDLGTFGGSQSVAKFVNAAGQVAGSYYHDSIPGGFLWSRKDGSVKIAPEAPAGVRVTGLNSLGEVAGNRPIPDDNEGFATVPFVWTARQGLRLLPLGGAVHGSVDALNNRSARVGFVERNPGDPSGRRAVYWNGMAGPVDLTSRLFHAPAGLVLYAGIAINDAGDILADSSAGLVLLHPGTTGTAAPVLGPIAGGSTGDTVALGGKVDFTAAFVDSSAAETHTAQASVDDGCPQEAPAVREVRGSGEVDLCHTFCRAGNFKVRVKVTDRAGNAAEVQRALSVADAPAPAPLGKGSPAAVR